MLRFLPIVFNLERANQLSPLPDKDLADFCPLIEPYQVTKNQILLGSLGKNRQLVASISNAHRLFENHSACFAKNQFFHL
ncbi:hypothetical protein [Microcystis aeruginosa]|uniref:hypothetical protein n=1 Tax=Microcystis aeruginosa TaxID=1126 RepID=UPI0030FE3B5F